MAFRRRALFFSFAASLWGLSAETAAGAGSSKSVGAVSTTATEAKKTPSATKGARLDLSLCLDSPTIWRRALSSTSNEYCRQVNRAQANLGTRPRLAEQYARDALKRSPQGVVAQLLVGEALLLQGRTEQAHVQLRGWMKVAPAVALTPRLRVSAARAALLQADYVLALELYRGAILRLDAFPSEREQTRILIEAATAAAYSESKLGREARGYLAIARQKSAPLLVETLIGAWTLSLLREGRTKEAAAMAHSLSDSFTVSWIVERQAPSVGKPSEVLPVLPPGEGFAMAAAVAQMIEPSLAESHWLSFRELADPSWPEHIEHATPGGASGAGED